MSRNYITMHGEKTIKKVFFFTFVPCILILSKFFCPPTDAQVIVLKIILKLTLKQFRHVSAQSNHRQGAHYISAYIYIYIYSHITTHTDVF
jgi:hypothetical protein